MIAPAKTANHYFEPFADRSQTAWDAIKNEIKTCWIASIATGAGIATVQASAGYAIVALSHLSPVTPVGQALTQTLPHGLGVLAMGAVVAGVSHLINMKHEERASRIFEKVPRPLEYDMYEPKDATRQRTLFRRAGRMVNEATRLRAGSLFGWSLASTVALASNLSTHIATSPVTSTIDARIMEEMAHGGGWKTLAYVALTAWTAKRVHNFASNTKFYTDACKPPAP